MSYKILAIDDSPTLRKFIIKHLSAHSANYHVLTAANGMEGVEMAGKEKPDLILLDFILPDMNGEDVCNKLSADSGTSSIPVVLMSSSAPDITRTEGKFDAIKRTMVKPFSPELLCATVGNILKSNVSENTSATQPPSASATSIAPALEDARPASQLVYCGETDYFPMLHALLAAEKKRLTGLLKLHCGRHPVEIYFNEGSLLLATTRDVDIYLAGTPLEIPPEQEAQFNRLRKEQEETANPIFLQMLDQNLAPPDEAEIMADQYGSYLISSAWTAPSFTMEFYRLTELPAYLSRKKANSNNVLAWALDSLRLVGEQYIKYPGLNHANGTPTYTKTGYDRIQILPLNSEEVAFANQVAAGNQSLSDMAAALGINLEIARQILFRFVALEVFDYWPQPECPAEPSE